eukprot:211736_1
MIFICQIKTPAEKIIWLAILCQRTMDDISLLKKQTRDTNSQKGCRQVIIALLLSTIAIAVAIWICHKDYVVLGGCNKDYFKEVFALLSSWSFLLLIFNLIEGCKVKSLTNYYIPSKHMNKSYIFTSLPLLMYFVIFVILLSLDINRNYYLENVVAGSLIYLLLFLSEFLGIRDFHFISWTFGIHVKCCCCQMKWFFISMRIILFIWSVAFPSTIVYVLYGQVSDGTLLLLSVSVLSLLLTIVLNPILAYSLKRYTKSLSLLLQENAVQNTFDEEMYANHLKQLKFKKWKVRIYFVFVLVISILSLSVVTASNVSNPDLFGWKLDVSLFSCHVITLCLLTLILYFITAIGMWYHTQYYTEYIFAFCHAIVSVRCGFLQHMANHRAYNSIYMNEIIG